MNEFPRLTQLQQRFKEAVSRELQSIPSDWLPLKKTQELALSVRMNIYQYAYWARIEESLEEDFERVKKRIGKKKFKTAVRKFIIKYPSKYSSLAELSRNFSQFWLDEHKPLLAELARFEWLQTLCFLTEDAEPSNLGELGALPLEILETLQFQLAPSLIFFESKYPVHTKAIKEKRKTFLILYRFHNQGMHRALTEKQWRLLKAIGEGQTLGQLAESERSKSLSEEQITECFSSWVSQGIIHSFKKS